MKPVQKNGRPIHGALYGRLLATGRTLEALGYLEHATKPNLFVRKYASVVFYADLRGSAVIDMWEDERALFWWQWRSRRLDLEVRRRVVLLEWSRIHAVTPRLSFEMTDASSAEAHWLQPQSESDVEGTVIVPALQASPATRQH